MRRILQFVFVMALAAGVYAPARAQNETTVTGTVTSSDDNSPLPGVSVVVKGTQTGTTTNANGVYIITAPANGTLAFSFIGMLAQEVPVGNRSTINVKLISDTKALNEVVVIGYGVQQKSKLTTSQSSVQGKEIANLTTPSFDQQLAGRAAGVQVTVGSGVVGQAPRIRIRGTNSITSGGSPLIVVDNIPAISGNQSGATPTNPLADINPQDIETIEILKDGAATAIYGSRAANGVILITTKKGRKNQPLRVSADVQYGITDPINRFDLLNANEFIAIANEKLANTIPAGAPRAFPDPNGADTDWQDVVLRRGTSQNYNLNFSGGSEKSNYYFSVGYSDLKGAVVSNGQKRYSFTSNIDHNISKFISVGTKLQVTRTENVGLNTGSNALSGNLTGAARLFPNVPIFNAAHPTGYNISPDGAVLGQGANQRAIDNNYTNLQFVLDNNQFAARTNRILSNSYLQVNILPGLFARTQLGIDYTDVRSFSSLDPRHGDGRGSNGIMTQTSRNILRWNWQNTLNYLKDIGSHSFNVVVGTEYQKQDINTFTAQGANFSDRFFIQDNLISGSFTTPTVFGGATHSGFESYFGRILYDYANKYFATFSVRNDGISALSAANRQGTFFGGSLAYKLSEEEFYKNSSVSQVLNSIKLRASLAQVGNVEIGDFPYLGVFGSAQYATQNGIAFAQAGNPNLRWETSNQQNFGLDLGFLNDRLTFSAEYFKNDVTGLILNAPTAPSLGVPNNAISRNVGSLYNQGWEFNLNYEILNKGKLTWSVNANFSALQNQVTALNKGLDGKDQDIFPSVYHIIRVGEPVAALYGYVVEGVNPANGFPLFQKGDGRVVQRNVNTGAYSFYDPANPTVTTNTTGASLSALDASVRDANGNIIGDRRVLGNTNPTWFGGLTNFFKVDGFDLEIFTRFSGGNKVLNLTRQETLLNQDFNNNGREILNRWTREGQVTDVPKMVLNNGNIINLNGNATSRFVESGDFLRVQNIVLGYTLPKSLVDLTRNTISSLRIYAQVQNVLTLTRYKGLDPELNANGDVNQTYGLDFNTNPQFRAFTFGITVGL